MDRATILAKPSWQMLMKRNPAIFAMSSSLLLAADSFFDFVGEFGLSQPQADDLLAWTKKYDQDTQNRSLTQLRDALGICAPTGVAIAEQAIRKLAEDSASKEARTEPLTNPASNPLDLYWDPISPSGPAPVARRVSIPPQDLPERWQQGLRDAANGLTRGGPAPANAIVVRMREKLCQFAWSCREHGLSVRFTPESVALYEQDVRDRSELGKFGLRWATVRASIEELLRFARYVGESEAVLADLRTRRRALSSLENSQLAIKYFEIARTGNTTDRILETLLHKSADGPGLPFPQADSPHGFCDRNAKRGVAIQDSDTHLNLCDLTVKVPRHEPLTQQFQAMHLCLDAASAVIATPVPPQCPAQILRGAERIVSGDGASGAWLPWLGVSARRDDRSRSAVRDSIVASARVVCSVCSDAADLLIARDLIE
jgi:hypothetical protein